MKTHLINILVFGVLLISSTFCKKERHDKDKPTLSNAFLPEGVNGYLDTEHKFEFSDDAFRVQSTFITAGFVSQSIQRDSIRFTHLIESAGIITLNSFALDTFNSETKQPTFYTTRKTRQSYPNSIIGRFQATTA